MKFCMLSYSLYETDARVRRYAESLLERGNEVDVICLSRNASTMKKKVNGVSVYEIQTRNFDEKSKWGYFRQILSFFLKAFIFLSWRYSQKKYDLIHVHNVPDCLVFAAIIPKMLGTKIILDIHDILPEFFASKFKTDKKGLAFKSLLIIERLSAAFSNHVIVSNHLWGTTLSSRSVKPEKLSVLMNYPDDKLFFHRGARTGKKRMIMMYPGTLNWHQGVDIAVRAFAAIKDDLPNLDFHIYGLGPNKTNLERLAQDLGLKDRIIFKAFLPLEKIPYYMADADIGIVPKRNDSFGGTAFSTKILQFMALGVPVVVSRTTIDQYYFNESLVKFFTPDNEKDLADRIKDLALQEKVRAQLAVNGLNFVKNMTWSRKKEEYLKLVDHLVKI